jgi:hypothetical protein
VGALEGTHGRSLVTFAGVGGVLSGWALGAVVRRFSTRTGVSDEEAFGPCHVAVWHNRTCIRYSETWLLLIGFSTALCMERR